MSEALRSQLTDIDQLLKSYNQVTECMVNSDGRVWIEASGETIDTGAELSAERRYSIIRLLAGYHDLIVNRERPALGVKVPVWGARFQGLVPPVTQGPSFSIRFPSAHVMTLDDLHKAGTLSAVNRDFLAGAINDKRNILISGGTGSGKTTLATALLQLVTTERIVLIEDNPEIRLNTPNSESMLTSPAFSLREAVQVSLRLNPDRIIVGEVRDGGTALELAKAWQTGHPGGIGTIHASSAHGVYNRLYSLMQEEVVTPNWETIMAAADIVVFIEKVKTKSGSRRQVTEVLDSMNEDVTRGARREIAAGGGSPKTRTQKAGSLKGRAGLGGRVAAR